MTQWVALQDEFDAFFDLCGLYEGVYLDTAIIFAGPLMIRVQSSSPNRDLAKTALNQFVDIMRVEEGPPAQPPEQKSPQGTRGI